MNYRSIIALGLGCLSIGIFLPGFTHNALARPEFPQDKPVDRVQTGTVVSRPAKISGYLVGTDGTYDNVPCTALAVKLVESLPTKPGQLFNSKVLATSNGIKQPDGTCQYELNFTQARSQAVRFKEKNYQIQVGGSGYAGVTAHQTKESLPDYLMLNVVMSKTAMP